ncbi:unnamed protein product [Effrenium voratum]|uniref:Nucleotide-diphospho-sugar transferase domain-containing protein n=1 Tax=Effrenium voratum TaxID=2562239 RepID=A0AA36IQY3_9DINO|nr:unnamed protein product [Effrenium voratum]
MIAESVWNSSAAAFEFPDYDCQWAGQIAGAAAEWSELREQLIAGGLELSPSTLALAHVALEQNDAAAACPLGRAAACWALHVAGVRSCEQADDVFQLLPAISTRWPLLRFLATVHRQGSRARGSCEQLPHPSIRWDDFRAAVEAAALEEFEEDKMETLSGPALEAAASEASGIVWKYSSAAEYEGIPIGTWTAQCRHGVAAAFALRAFGLILGDLDVFKMVESSLSIIGENRIIDLLDSGWALFATLHRLSCAKKRWDDVALAPRDLQPMPFQTQADFDFHQASPAAQLLAELLSRAAPGPVLVVFLPTARAHMLPRYVAHLEKPGLDILGRSLFLPQSEHIRRDCIELVDSCLPVLSVFPELAKYSLLAFAAQLKVDVLFTEMDTFWLQNPFPRLAHSDGADVYVPQEFYSSQTRPSIMLVRSRLGTTWGTGEGEASMELRPRNTRSWKTLAAMATWLLRFPFISANLGMQHLLEPDRPGFVPSVSFLRPVEELRLGVLDSENEFVTLDGWFGHPEAIVALELGGFFADDFKLPLLDQLYAGTADSQKLILGLQKSMSPKRPLHAHRPITMPTDVRIVHVNFADGCCEAEQQRSSSTAMEFGANESRALGGQFLDAEFRSRNAHLLDWVRGSELTNGKTPSGKVGYYVWKPYVVLKTLKDPAIQWNEIVLWTDAGVHFISPLRPLVRDYLAHGDVSATQTPMMECDVTKRDAFLLLDADYESIIRTNQIATGIILARKTPLSIRFMEHWLAACEDERIITETPSVLGHPDYPHFRHHNDDQSAFSLLFKKYGFHPFLQAERDLYVVAARNAAKFVAASDAFALGKSCSQDEYISAANAAASP